MVSSVTVMITKARWRWFQINGLLGGPVSLKSFIYPLRFEQMLKEVRSPCLMKQSLNLSEIMPLFCSLFSPVHIPTVFKLGSGDSGSSFGCFGPC